MKTPINYDQLWETLTSGQQGYLVLDPKTGLSSLTRITLKGYINGRFSGDPLAPHIFYHGIEELNTLWSDKRNIAQFARRVNFRGFRRNKPETAKQWAEFFEYQDFGQWRSHGLPGIYDELCDQKLDDIDGYYEINLRILTRLDHLAYVLIGQIWEALNYGFMQDVMLIKPEGSEFSPTGTSHESIQAIKVPERFRAMIEAFATVMTL